MDLKPSVKQWGMCVGVILFLITILVYVYTYILHLKLNWHIYILDKKRQKLLIQKELTYSILYVYVQLFAPALMTKTFQSSLGILILRILILMKDYFVLIITPRRQGKYYHSKGYTHRSISKIRPFCCLVYVIITISWITQANCDISQLEICRSWPITEGHWGCFFWVYLFWCRISCTQL